MPDKSSNITRWIIPGTPNSMGPVGGAALTPLLDKLGIGSWSYMPARGKFSADTALEALLGYHPGTLPTEGRFLTTLVVDDDIEQLSQDLAALRAGDECQLNREHRVKHRDGHEIWLHTAAEVRFGDTDEELIITGVSVEITSRIDAEQRREEAVNQWRDIDARYHAVFENAATPILMLQHHKITNCNAAALKLLGLHTHEELLGRNILDFSVATQSDDLAASDAVSMFMQESCDQTLGGKEFDWLFVDLNGREIATSVEITRLKREGAESLTIAVIADRSAIAGLQLNSDLADAIFDGVSEAILVTDADNHIVSVNQCYEKITGSNEKDIIGKRAQMLEPGDEQQQFYYAMWADITANGEWNGQLWCERADRSRFLAELRVKTLRDERGRCANRLIMFNDITEQHQQNERLDFLSTRDDLTGMVNIATFKERAATILSDTDHTANILYLSAPQTALLSTTHGDEAVDELVKEIATRITSCIGEHDLAARAKGDEFVVLLTQDPHSPGSAAGFESLRKAVEQPIKIDSRISIQPSLQIGIAIFPDNAATIDELIRQAHSAWSQTHGQHAAQGLSFFSPDSAEKYTRRVTLESSLREALRNDEFRLFYQPTASLQTSLVTGAEALLRWQRPQHGLQQPADFLSVIEDSYLANPVGRWVLQSAIADAAALHRHSGNKLQVSINVSAPQFESGTLVDDIKRSLQNSGLDAQYVSIEVVERLLMHDTEIVQAQLNELKKIGVTLVLDDFGTGFSSLGYLSRFPFDVLKIDRCFIQDLLTNPHSAAIVRSTIAMSHQLGMKVVAEGVENIAQAAMLKRNLCDVVQGHLLGEAMPLADFERRLQSGPTGFNLQFPRHLSPIALVVGDVSQCLEKIWEKLTATGWSVAVCNNWKEAWDYLGTRNVRLLIAGDSDGSLQEKLATTKKQYPTVTCMSIGCDNDRAEMLAMLNSGLITHSIFSEPSNDFIEDEQAFGRVYEQVAMGHSSQLH